MPEPLAGSGRFVIDGSSDQTRMLLAKPGDVVAEPAADSARLCTLR